VGAVVDQNSYLLVIDLIHYTAANDADDGYANEICDATGLVSDVLFSDALFSDVLFSDVLVSDVLFLDNYSNYRIHYFGIAGSINCCSVKFSNCCYCVYFSMFEDMGYNRFVD
jgi:hypothetical protein